MRIRREQERWLFAAAFVATFSAGLLAFGLADGFSASVEINRALIFAAAILVFLAPPAVRRFAWHTFANHVGVGRPRKITGAFALDGDTIEDCVGIRYRLANIDAPETGDNAKCHHERERGELAKSIARNLLVAAQRVEVRATFRTDRYGRQVAFILVDDEDLGELLIARGLARPWRGQRRRWCGPNGGLAKMARAGLMAHQCNTCRSWRGG